MRAFLLLLILSVLYDSAHAGYGLFKLGKGGSRGSNNREHKHNIRPQGNGNIDYDEKPERVPDVSSSGPTGSKRFKDTVLARMKFPGLSEISGLSRSSKAGVLWSHNDSGDRARIYAIDTRTGNVISQATLKGVNARDFEDITYNRGTIYVGDIGDNFRLRSFISIYRLREPALHGHPSIRAERFELNYPDGRKNSEAIMIDPIFNELFLISKEGRKAQLFHVPLNKRKGTLKALQMLKVIKEPVTGSDISPNGREIIVVGTDNMFLFTRNQEESVPQAMSRAPTIIGKSVKGQCEAVTFEGKSKAPGFYSITEGRGRAMHYFRRQ